MKLPERFQRWPLLSLAVIAAVVVAALIGLTYVVGQLAEIFGADWLGQFVRDLFGMGPAG